ncbi:MULTISPECIES: nuclear transport factor 2 family protein [unclassified Amycolatopsis]|uniref:nuclear transport factor 2 family protein n=1 Tax=unclassified Amycolatopsis TaxID=2618356 RepID=UPI001F0D4F13|nr:MULTISPECIES: nuclear transport factor 2 family protein [unclassified Amycolatopsis]
MYQEMDAGEFARRYVEVWNEPDPAARRAAIASLWAEDGVQFTESAEFRGHQELERRVSEAFEEFVGGAGFVFRPAGDAVGHHGTVRFSTYMVPAAGGEVAWTGFVVLELGEDGRIRRDCQFAEPPRPTFPDARAVVEEFLRRIEQGDPDRIAELFAEPVDWRLSWPEPAHPVVPWIRPRSSRADIADHFRTLGSACVPEESDVRFDRILVDGADALFFGTSTQTVRLTGKRFTTGLAVRVTVSGGQITRYHVYEDSLAVAEAFAG